MIKIKDQVAKIRKIGNSLYIVVKKEIAEILNLKKGNLVKYSIEKIQLIEKEKEIAFFEQSKLDYKEFQEYKKEGERKEKENIN